MAKAERTNLSYYARSSRLEDSAAQNIFNLFDALWEDTSKKSSRQITALVLDTMAAACITSDRETSDHQILYHSNQYFDKMSHLLKSDAPLSVAITGNDLSSIISNLQSIQHEAEKEPYGKEISGRISLFINKLLAIAQQYQSARRNAIIKSAIISLLIALGILALIDTIAYQNPLYSISEHPSFLLLAALFGLCGIPVVFNRIFNNRNN